jgi:DNA polymerase I
VADETPRELFLIDGNSLVFRAFFALPESIATSKGFPTNAIFGFASMLVKIITDYGAKPTLVVWDAGLSGRLEVYEEYKAGRRDRPDLLSEQWPHLHPLVEAFGYDNLKVPGYEADDVIATIAGRAREKDIEVMVVTGDRDLFQLIEPGVRVMATSRGITDTKVYDRRAVIDRYGIPPELIPDFVGLKGDTSDNIPGVPGIGDKTASQLLQDYGDLEGVLSNIDSISGAKRKQNLTEHAEDARVSKVLATAEREIDVDVDLDHVVAREPDRSRLRETFREFELRAPLERLEEALGEDQAAPAERVEEVVNVEAREVALAEVGSLDGELVAVAALRAGETPDEAAAAGGEGLEPEQVEAELAAEEEAAAEAVVSEEPVAADEMAEAEPAVDAAPATVTASATGQVSFDIEGAAPGPLAVAAFAGEEVLVAEAETLAAFALARDGRPVVAHD